VGGTGTCVVLCRALPCSRMLTCALCCVWVQRSSDTLFYALFLLLMWCDGAVMAVANLVDVDCGGLEVVATQYNSSSLPSATSTTSGGGGGGGVILSVSESRRKRLTATHEAVFDGAMIVLSPLLAGAALALDHSLLLPSLSSDSAAAAHPASAGVGALVLVVAGVFALSSAVSWCSYRWALPALPPLPEGAAPPIATRIKVAHAYLITHLSLTHTRSASPHLTSPRMRSHHITAHAYHLIASIAFTKQIPIVH
jgi:hypothetical protein